MYQARDLGTFSPKWHVSIKSLSLKVKGAQQRMQKDYMSQWRQETPRKQGLLDTTKLTHMNQRLWQPTQGQMESRC